MNRESGDVNSPPRVLVVLGHGRRESLCHRICKTLRETLQAAGAEVRLHDLLADGFDPVLRLPEGARHALPEHATPLGRRYQQDVSWMDTLVIIHPVWWFAPPAILKGWVDQVLVDTVAIRQETPRSPRPLLKGRRALLIQTFNASRWQRFLFVSKCFVYADGLALPPYTHGA